MDRVHIIFLILIVTILNTITINIYKIGEWKQNNKVNNFDYVLINLYITLFSLLQFVHIIHENIIASTLKLI